jgi:undecaprenyl-diphosphatase
MIAATAYSLYKARADLSLDGLGQIAVGFAVAFVVALVTVKAVLAFISRIGFTPFGWYRIVLGAVMLLVLALA